MHTYIHTYTHTDSYYVLLDQTISNDIKGTKCNVLHTIYYILGNTPYTILVCIHAIYYVLYLA